MSPTDFIDIDSKLFDVEFQCVIQLLHVQNVHVSRVDDGKFQTFQFVLDQREIRGTWLGKNLMSHLRHDFLVQPFDPTFLLLDGILMLA